MRSLLLFLLLLALCSTSRAAAEKLSIVRVNVTTQGWDFARPWGKHPPITRRAIGAVIAGPRVLVSSDLVANSTYVEFESAEGGKKVAASVEFVDYEANLALLKTDDPTFLADLPKLEVAPSNIGDTLSFLQLENSGRLLTTKGPMTTAEVAAYPVDGSLLIYRVTVQLQNRDNSFTMPVVKDGKLTGVLIGYDNPSNNANLIPAPVIQHFLKDVADGKYEGFPRAGFAYGITRDPQLRSYLKIPADVTGGIYITEVLKDGPAAKAGLMKGDVLIGIDEFSLDQDGNYSDPAYGKIPFSYILTVKHFSGEVAKLHILRAGEHKTLEATLNHRSMESYVSEPYQMDRGPKFIIVGGLVFQELSRQYLKDIGPEYQGRMPDRLVHYDRYQSELFKDGPKKVVFLSAVLASPATVGYEELSHIVVKKINDVELQSLADIPEALTKPQKGFHKIQFEEDPQVIYLDVAEVEKLDPLIQKQYRIPTMKRLE